MSVPFVFGSLGRAPPPPMTLGLARTSTEHGVRFEMETSADDLDDDAKSVGSFMSEMRFTFPTTDTIEEEFTLLSDVVDELFSRVEALLIALKAQKK